MVFQPQIIRLTDSDSSLFRNHSQSLLSKFLIQCRKGRGQTVLRLSLFIRQGKKNKYFHICSTLSATADELKNLFNF